MKEEIIKIISEVLEVSQDDINEKTDLVKDLEVESLDVVDLIAAFEKKYQIEIPDSEIKKLLTVGDIVNYIEKHYV